MEPVLLQVLKQGAAGAVHDALGLARRARGELDLDEIVGTGTTNGELGLEPPAPPSALGDEEDEEEESASGLWRWVKGRLTGRK